MGGLGFTFKWNMGWMHDILTYVSKDPVYRRWEHQHLTFSMLYAFNENFVLPFSHDEVVHGKGSMIDKMPGDVWQKAATLRALYAFMYAHPGKKLLFMGCEFGQWREWNHDDSLDWHLLEQPLHAGLQRFVEDLNTLYRREPALHEVDFDAGGLRVDRLQRPRVERDLAHPPRRAIRTTWSSSCSTGRPSSAHDYRVGVPDAGFYEEMLNSDAAIYGGSNVGNEGGRRRPSPFRRTATRSRCALTLPPLAGARLQARSQTFQDRVPLLVADRHHRQTRHPDEREVREARVGLDLGQRHRPRQLLHRHEIDDVGLAGLVGRVGIRRRPRPSRCRRSPSRRPCGSRRRGRPSSTLRRCFCASGFFTPVQVVAPSFTNAS